MGTARRQYADEFKRTPSGCWKSAAGRCARSPWIWGSPLRGSALGAGETVGARWDRPGGPIRGAAIPLGGKDLAAENCRLRRENDRGPRFRLWMDRKVALAWAGEGSGFRFWRRMIP